jgi:hypothetical protein
MNPLMSEYVREIVATSPPASFSSSPVVRFPSGQDSSTLFGWLSQLSGREHVSHPEHDR